MVAARMKGRHRQAKASTGLIRCNAMRVVRIHRIAGRGIPEQEGVILASRAGSGESNLRQPVDMRIE